MSVLEEEILHQQQNYKSLVKEQERLLKEKAEQDQRLQREIRDRLCLKMVRFIVLFLVNFKIPIIFEE